MANELPEVVPLVQSMPTTGWIIQTKGSARRRVTTNKSTSDTGGIYDVAGVPGLSHKASAGIAVDADYTRYRTVANSVARLLWGYGAMNLPIGMLDDSVEPDNASERYERAIERCINSISLFPENCTGNIHEPTRSIGEIRTLVTPKARLNTLTYIEERRGWRVPDAVAFARIDRDGVLYTNENTRPALVSQFPDVYVDVRPLQQVRDGTVVRGVEPSSLYLDTPGKYRYIIRDATAAEIGGAGPEQHYYQPTNGLANIGVLSDGSAWDGTMRFVWDDDLRQYVSVPFQVTLHAVVEVLKEDGELPAQDSPDYTIEPGADLAAPDDHLHRISVEFPVVTTTRFGGNADQERGGAEPRGHTYGRRADAADPGRGGRDQGGPLRPLHLGGHARVPHPDRQRVRPPGAQLLPGEYCVQPLGQDAGLRAERGPPECAGRRSLPVPPRRVPAGTLEPSTATESDHGREG